MDFSLSAFLGKLENPRKHRPDRAVTCRLLGPSIFHAPPNSRFEIRSSEAVCQVRGGSQQRHYMRQNYQSFVKSIATRSLAVLGAFVIACSGLWPASATTTIGFDGLTLADGTVIRIPQENHAALAAVLRPLRSGSSGEPLVEARHA